MPRTSSELASNVRTRTFPLNPQGLVPSLVLENGTDAYGKWNSVFRRYRRWALTGVFDAMLETPAEMAGGSDPPT